MSVDTTALDLHEAANRAQAAAGISGPVLEQVRMLQVQDAPSEQTAVEITKQIREQRKQIEAERDSAIKPLKSVVDKIRGWFKPPVDDMKAAETHLRDLVSAYRRRVAAETAARLREATSQAEIQQAQEAMVPKAAGSHTRDRWGYEIVDASKIPRDYWILDEKRIAREAKASKDKLNIPGIKPVNDPIVVIR